MHERPPQDGRALEGVSTNPFSVLPRSTLPDEIAGQLLTLIKSQRLRPGDKLPAERDLARMMSVSRPVIREALRALAIMQVVDIRQGSGTYITSLEPHKLLSHVDIAFSKDSVALIQLIEARRVIEVGNVRLAADRITAGQLQRLDALLDALDGAVDDAVAFSDLDIRFHDVLSEAASNFLLAQFMSVINTLAKVSRERSGSHENVRRATAQDLRRIRAALAAHDADAAALAMRTHLDRVGQALEADTEAAASRPVALMGAAGPEPGR